MEIFPCMRRKHSSYQELIQPCGNERNAFWTVFLFSLIRDIVYHFAICAWKVVKWVCNTVGICCYSDQTNNIACSTTTVTSEHRLWYYNRNPTSDPSKQSIGRFVGGEKQQRKFDFHCIIHMIFHYNTANFLQNKLSHRGNIRNVLWIHSDIGFLLVVEVPFLISCHIRPYLNETHLHFDMHAIVGGCRNSSTYYGNGHEVFAWYCIFQPGGRLNKKDGLTRYGDSHVKDKTS